MNQDKSSHARAPEENLDNQASNTKSGAHNSESSPVSGQESHTLAKGPAGLAATEPFSPLGSSQPNLEPPSAAPKGARRTKGRSLLFSLGGALSKVVSCVRVFCFLGGGSKPAVKSPVEVQKVPSQVAPSKAGERPVDVDSLAGEVVHPKGAEDLISAEQRTRPDGASESAPEQSPEEAIRAWEKHKQEERIKEAPFLRDCFDQALRRFDKNVAEEVLFANLNTEGPFGVQLMMVAARNAGLSAEMRRVNIFDITSGVCVLMLKNSASVLLIDGTTLYDPKTKTERPINREEINDLYVGYAIFFYELDLKISSFIKRTGFLFSSISGFKITFVEVIVLSLFINLFALVVPFYSMNVYDRIIPNSAMSSLLVLSVGVILAYLFDAVFKSIKHYATEFVSGSIGQEIDQKLYNKLVNMKSPGIPLSDGAKMSLFRELQMVREFYFSRFIPMIIDIPFLVIFVVVLMMISPLVAAAPVIISLIVFVVNVLVQVPMQANHANMMQQDQNRNAFLAENINNLETIKIFNGYGKSLSKWLRISDSNYRHNLKYSNWVGIASNFSVMMMNLSYIFVVIAGVHEIMLGVMTSGALIACSTLSSRVMAPIVGFSSMIVRYRSIQDVLRHLERIIDSPSEDETHSYSQKGPFRGKIEFKNVTFFYPSLKQPILSKCSFSVQPGEKVGIIGRTGAGKSTITRLLLGLDFANEGAIKVDDIDVNDIHVRELRKNIGYLPQRSQFFRGTLKENILISNTPVTDEQYKRIFELSGVRRIIERTGLGDDMLINEHGNNISGGQQQIIALARAIIHEPPILVLDEPTTGMDTTLEAEFMQNLRAYAEDKTLILITHKAAQLALVDRVILIEQGRVLVDDTKERVLNVLLSKTQAK